MASDHDVYMIYLEGTSIRDSPISIKLSDQYIYIEYEI